MKKLIFSSKYFMFLFMLSSLVYVGCHKDDGKEVVSVSSENTELRTRVTPSVVNGVLKFETDEDVHNFLMQVESDLKINENAISDLESTLGYTSLYTTSKNAENLGQSGSVFIDPSLNALLNSNYEFIIGENLVVKKNHDETWLVPLNDEVGKSKLRSKLPGSFIEDSDITSTMIIDGRVEAAVSASCCKRNGRWPKNATWLESGSVTYQNNSYKLRGRGEVYKGSWWGIYIYAETSGMKNNNPENLHLFINEVSGKFRNKNCELKHNDSASDVCNSCKKLGEKIFHRSGKNEFFNEGEIGLKFRLYFPNSSYLDLVVPTTCN